MSSKVRINRLISIPDRDSDWLKHHEIDIVEGEKKAVSIPDRDSDWLKPSSAVSPACRMGFNP